MSVAKKNKNLIRLFLPLDLLDDHEANPNVLSDKGFDMLVANMEDVGFTDPMLVWPRGMTVQFQQVLKDAKSAGIKVTGDFVVDEFIDMLRAAGIRFTFVGGHHRRNGLQYLGETYGFCTVIADDEFDEDAAEAQLMRNNLIHGKLDPQKFAAMATRQMQKGLTEDEIQILYGFADDAEFRKMVDSLAKQLPTQDLQDKFKKAAEEIKTIDGLAKLLNRMFSLYGDTLPYGYLVVDYGGQHSIWLRAEKKTFDAVTLIGQACVENDVTLDEVLGRVLQAIARGDAADLIGPAFEKSPKASLPAGLVGLPTKDVVEKMKSMADG